MKIKSESLNILNKKKNALPTSKFIKPKKFKSSVKKVTDTPNSLTKDKIKLVKNEHIIPKKEKSKQLDRGQLLVKRSILNSVDLKHTAKPSLSVKENSPISNTNPDIQKLASLFDFATSEQKNDEINSKTITSDLHLKNNRKKGKQNLANLSSNKKSKPGDSVELPKPLVQKANPSLKNEKGKRNSVKLPAKQTSSSISEQTKNTVEKEIKSPTLMKSSLNVNKVKDATEGLFKLIKEKSSKPGLLDEAEPVLMQVECVKIPIIPSKQLRFRLPHPLIGDTADVLLITSDLKGHKIYPDKAVDHYEELLAQHHINFINKVMPIRMIRKEYSQYELRRKLVDQFDVILADARIIRSLPTVLGKFIMFTRKMPIPVRLNIGNKLKEHLQDAISKTQMTIKSNGHTSTVQVGHSKMKPEEIAANIVKVAKDLEGKYPGGWRNIRSLFIKTARSVALPIYLSLVSPNEVRIPVEVRRKPPPVEGELSTMPGVNVIVTHDGNVILKKVEEEPAIDNSRDDEILEEAEKYIESSKTVRHDESSDEEEANKNEDSDMEADAVTDAMEQEVLNIYEENVKSKKKDKDVDEEVNEEGDDEVEESEEEEEEKLQLAPVPSKKRKMKGAKTQVGGPPVKKQFKHKDQKGEKKKDKSKGGNQKGASPGLKKPQMRGSRGGKKNKMSKDQRKALIKRRKAGKK